MFNKEYNVVLLRKINSIAFSIIFSISSLFSSHNLLLASNLTCGKHSKPFVIETSLAIEQCCGKNNWKISDVVEVWRRQRKNFYVFYNWNNFGVCLCCGSYLHKTVKFSLITIHKKSKTTNWDVSWHSLCCQVSLCMCNKAKIECIIWAFSSHTNNIQSIFMQCIFVWNLKIICVLSRNVNHTAHDMVAKKYEQNMCVCFFSCIVCCEFEQSHFDCITSWYLHKVRRKY